MGGCKASQGSENDSLKQRLREEEQVHFNDYEKYVSVNYNSIPEKYTTIIEKDK